MRDTRKARANLFIYYETHELGEQLSALLDPQLGILPLIDQDLLEPDSACTGANELSVESFFHCLLLKQSIGESCDRLAFRLKRGHEQVQILLVW